ncbi:hypothetical protein K7W42_12790 [Deinococcus sp. HMF7604]|uniref:hypothetical protein n=1 Tax=Deinococcus betulae TaxID=2873312 RepID=UPI001CCBDA1E|nr:hypothetical protein [Deinococcus betulae]MBZ9751736.1 hypothetical protein [Deinococcus betulae]
MSHPTAEPLAADTPPATPAETAEGQVLQEVTNIHALLIPFEGQTLRPRTAPTPREQQEQLATRYWCGVVVGLALTQLPIPNPWIPLTFALLALVCVVISAWLGGSSLFREWKHRRLETPQLLNSSAAREAELIRALYAFSRPALLHVAASARAADQRLTSRISVILGPNKAGGVVGALFLMFGIFSAGKYLQDNEVKIPLVGLPITAETLLITVAVLLLGSFGILFASASLASLPDIADLLERVAALKKNLAEESRDQMREGR